MLAGVIPTPDNCPRKILEQNKHGTSEVMKKNQTTQSGQVAAGPAKPISLPAPSGAPLLRGESASSHKIFLLCIERAKNLLKIHKTAHGNQARPEGYLSDAHRAAIVLSISALDAYVRTVCLERIRVIVADKSRELPAALSAEIKKFLKDDHLLEAARKDDLLSRVEKAFRQDFERKSFQGVKSITECLQFAGFEDVFHAVAVAESLNEDNLKEELNSFTKRRHSIAHQGDYDLSQNPPVENTIRKSDAEGCIKLITKIAAAIHKLSGV